MNLLPSVTTFCHVIHTKVLPIIVKDNGGRYLNIIFVAGNQEMDMEDRGRDR